MRTPRRDVRYLSDDEERRLLAALPVHLVALVRFSLATGLRMRNATDLQWSQVDLGKRRAWIPASMAKSRRSIPVPLNNDAVSILRKVWGQHPDHCFTYQGQAFQRPNGRAWRQALRRAGIDNCRWHHLRHTWATRLAMAGTPLPALMEMGGWADLASVQCYAHFCPDHLQQYVERIAGTQSPVSGANLVQSEGHDEG